MAYFPIAFAASGDKTAIPNSGTETGPINFLFGYGSNYSESLLTNPSARKIDRETFNYLMNQITQALQQVYQNGLPAWITSAQNQGVPFPYAKNALVLAPDGNNYFSLVNANTAQPGTDPTKWQLFTTRALSQITVTASPGSTAANTTIVANGAGLITIPLPPTATTVDADSFSIVGVGVGGWKISQAAGQQMIFGNMQTTIGVGGFLSSTNRYDNLTFRYVAAASAWMVTSSIGNITVV